MRQRCLICAYDTAPILERLIPLLNKLSEYYEPLIFVQFPKTQRTLEKLGYETFLYRAVIGWEHGNLKPLSPLDENEPHHSYESSLYGTHYDWKHYESTLRKRIEEVFLVLQPDLLIVWNGLTLPMTQFVAAAKSNQIPIRYLERGLFPGSLFIDHLGANAASSIAHKRHFDRELIELGQTLCTTFKHHYTPIVPQASGRQTSPEWEKGKRRAVFIEQLDHDTNIILFAARYPTNEMALETFQAELDPNQWSILIKSHPEASTESRTDDGVQRSNAELQELIEESDLILTRNSSVGFEALIYNKPVRALGACFYQRFCVQSQMQSDSGDLSRQEEFYAFVGDLFYNHHIITDPSVCEAYPKAQGFDGLITSAIGCSQEHSRSKVPFWRRPITKFLHGGAWSLQLSIRQLRKRVSGD